MDITLECRTLAFSHGNTPILKDISFTVRRGRFCAILGRNGSGKTTLLHCLNRVHAPQRGQVLLQGKDSAELSQKQIAQRISLVPQEHMDMFPFRVIDVVVMGRAPFLALSALPGKADYQMAENALAALNASELAPKNFNQISGGERRIALLARAMTQATKIMLLDEPTNHLDFNNQYHLLSAIKNQCTQEEISIIASMHDPNMAALFADDVVMIKDGEVMAKGAAEDLMTRENISRLYDTPVEQLNVPGYPGPMFFPEQLTQGAMEA
ncbi:MAG: ABC transporter ATP-binding protein [Desulfobacterales bacterium]|nr:ABC transporter ATP-binding protein [Desulfobacterales bacterium]